MNKLKSIYNEIKRKVNPKNKKYNHKTICSEWKTFDNFYNWCMENNWQDGLTVYCKDHYSPETCELLTIKEARKKSSLDTCQKRYGVSHTSKIKGVVEKRQKTIIDRYGKDYNLTKEVQNKKKQTCFEKYGVEHPNKSQKVKDKIKNTNLKKYGVENQFQRKENIKYGKDAIVNKKGIKEKILNTKKENGICFVYKDKTYKEISKELNIKPVTLHHRVKKYGIEKAISIKKSETYIEYIIKNLLNKHNLKFEEKKYIGKYPDFIINNIVIECDGLYWHSELNLDKKYHKEKRQYYINKGYTPLFFYEDEILNKLPIIESIILNKLNKSKRVFARKCKIIELETKIANLFFENNHLMGKGKGRTFALLYKNEVITCIRVIKKNNGLDISRFASKIGYSNIGGFSKLIKNIENNTDYNSIQTFIDLRYGQGDYLEGLGFKSDKKDYLSFYWTDFKSRFNRMSFKGNSGYNNGLVKIWDCGQRKFIKCW